MSGGSPALAANEPRVYPRFMAHAAVPLLPTDQLLAAVMELPEPERARLVLELLSSLAPTADDGTAREGSPDADPELTAELQRRRRAYLAGETGWVSVEELASDLDDAIASVHR